MADLFLGRQGATAIAYPKFNIRRDIPFFRIRVRGKLDPNWSHRLEGRKIENLFREDAEQIGEGLQNSFTDRKKTKLNSNRFGCCFLAPLLLTASQAGMAQEAQSADDEATSTTQQFGGPGSVSAQLADDARHTESLTGREIGQSYSKWKDGVKDRYGLNFTVDYNSTAIKATNTLNQDDVFTGGVFRFFGQWDLTGRDTGNTGSLIWKIEYRHDTPTSRPAARKTK